MGLSSLECAALAQTNSLTFALFPNAGMTGLT
jgi:hypothetical protein